MIFTSAVQDYKVNDTLLKDNLTSFFEYFVNHKYLFIT